MPAEGYGDTTDFIRAHGIYRTARETTEGVEGNEDGDPEGYAECWRVTLWLRRPFGRCPARLTVSYTARTFLPDGRAPKDWRVLDWAARVAKAAIRAGSFQLWCDGNGYDSHKPAAKAIYTRHCRLAARLCGWLGHERYDDLLDRTARVGETTTQET